MQLDAFCLRCERHFEGPDEGCPECDKGNPDVSHARNRILPGKPAGWDDQTDDPHQPEYGDPIA